MHVFVFAAVATNVLKDTNHKAVKKTVINLNNIYLVVSLGQTKGLE